MKQFQFDHHDAEHFPPSPHVSAVQLASVSSGRIVGSLYFLLMITTFNDKLGPGFYPPQFVQLTVLLGGFVAVMWPHSDLDQAISILVAQAIDHIFIKAGCF